MKKIAGLDIGNNSIKLVEFEDRKGKLELKKCAFEAIKDGDVRAALSNLISREKISSKKVNISLAGLSVIVRHVEMPQMKIEELKSAIKFEAEKYIPFSMEESIIDCAVLDKTNQGTQRVILAAAKKSDVNKVLELLKEVGLEANVVDIDSFAFFNSFSRLNKESKKEKTYSVINIGAKLSNMNIIMNGNVFFTRDILWGGIDITNRIKDSLGMPFSEAEKLKLDPLDRANELKGVMVPILEKLTSQIRMSFDYFESQFGRNIETVYLSGGTSYLFNVVNFFTDNLGMETMVWNPFEGAIVPDNLQETERIKLTPGIFAVAAGLALRK